MSGGNVTTPRRLWAVLVAVGFTLLLGAWIMSTPPFAAPDEGSHYLRALSITNGHLLGPKARYPSSPLLTPAQHAFLDHDTRAVMVPALLSPTDVYCVDGKPDLSGQCVEVTPDGNFPVIGYLLPAAALAVSHDVGTGIWLARLGSALPCIAFLTLAVMLLWDGRVWSLLGLFAAVTPMVLFTSSILNSSGIGITSSLAFFAAGVRIARNPARSPRWAWLAFAGCGAVAILAGPIGLAFAIADLAVIVALLGRSGLRAIPRHGVEFRASVLTLVGASVLFVIYDRIAGFQGTFGITPIGASLRGGFHQLPSVLRDAVGTFSSLTVHLPLAAYWLWWAIVLALVGFGLVIGRARERVPLAAVAVLGLLFPVLFWAWVDRYTGFGLQGREVLPVLILIPLLAGEIISRRISIVTAPGVLRATAGLIVILTLFQGYAWWYNARAMAAGSGGIDFYVHATFIPPGGWKPWIATAALGTLALLIFGLREALGGLATRRTTPLTTVSSDA